PGQPTELAPQIEVHESQHKEPSRSVSRCLLSTQCSVQESKARAVRRSDIPRSLPPAALSRTELNTLTSPQVRGANSDGDHPKAQYGRMPTWQSKAAQQFRCILRSAPSGYWRVRQ